MGLVLLNQDLQNPCTFSSFLFEMQARRVSAWLSVSMQAYAQIEHVDLIKPVL